MPKKPIDYKNSCVYRLMYNDITYYVGSTTNMRQRKSHHNRSCNNKKNKEYDMEKYRFIRENGGFKKWIMVMIQAYPECKDGVELRMYERQHYDLLNPQLNSQRPYISDEERVSECNERSRIARLDNPERIIKWRNDNIEHIKEYRTQYNIDNADKIQEYRELHKDEKNEKSRLYCQENADKIKERDKKTVVCECGRVINYRHKKRHEKLNIHIKRMADLAVCPIII